MKICVRIIVAMLSLSSLASALFDTMWWFGSKPPPDAHEPMVVNTWPFTVGTDAAWRVLRSGTALDAVVAGCTAVEADPNITSVGFGHHPDEAGRVALDAMVMDGTTRQMGAVASLREVRPASQVARAVLRYTRTSLLVGEDATHFALEMGFTRESLETDASRAEYAAWRNHSCQPNFRRNVQPDPRRHCGPYRPALPEEAERGSGGTGDGREWLAEEDDDGTASTHADEGNHDTVGFVALDRAGHVAVGTSTNGLSHRVPGRVSDTALPGAGGYAVTGVGGAAATGDGDILMRYLLAYQAVEEMRAGREPSDACRRALARISPAVRYEGALVALDARTRRFGGACVGFDTFSIAVRDSDAAPARVIHIPCHHSGRGAESLLYRMASFVKLLFYYE